MPLVLLEPLVVFSMSMPGRSTITPASSVSLYSPAASVTTCVLPVVVLASLSMASAAMPPTLAVVNTVFAGLVVNSTWYCSPTFRLLNRYSPLTPVVVVTVVSPTPLITPSAPPPISVTVWPLMPASPASCWPSPSVSVHSRLPRLASLTRPASQLRSFSPDSSVVTIVMPLLAALTSLSVASPPWSCLAKL